MKLLKSVEIAAQAQLNKVVKIRSLDLNDNLLLILALIFFILTIGTPDIIDGMIHRLMK